MQAQPSANKLNETVVVLDRRGQFTDAVQVASEAVRLVTYDLGQNHPEVARSLHKLAELYVKIGLYADADSLFKRSLEIRERAFGAEHVEVAQSLNDLAHLHFRLGHYGQADVLHKRSLAIREKMLSPEHLDVAASVNNIGEMHHYLGLYPQSERQLRRALAIREGTLGPEHPDVANSLNNLGDLQITLGMYADAEILLKRSLAIREKSLGSDHPDVAASLHSLAELHSAQSRTILAEQFANRALAIRERTFGANHISVAESLNTVAEMHFTRGQYESAEVLVKRSLSIQEQALGPDHPDVASSLQNLASLNSHRGHYAAAMPLAKRALAIRERALGPTHASVASSSHIVAELHYKQGDFALAEPLEKRALAIREGAFGPDHPDVALSLHKLAELHNSQGNFVQAESLYRRALEIRERFFGTEHPNVATGLNNIAGVHEHLGQYADAEKLFKRSLEIRQKTQGFDHPDVATNLNNLAYLFRVQGQNRKAIAMSSKASEIYRRRIVSGGTENIAIQEALKNQDGFLQHLSLLASNPNNDSAEKIADEAFQIVQLQQASGTASAIAKMSARFAHTDDALGALIKRKQDAHERRATWEAQLLSSASRTPRERNLSEERQLREDIALASKAIDTLDAEFTRSFPEYQELTRPEPVPVAQVRALLKPHEAMLVYSLSNTSFFWVVKPDGAVFVPLELKVKPVAGTVAKIRGEMEFDKFGRTKPVSVALLHTLYLRLFAPVLPHLAGVRHLMVVPTGPLLSLPFGMLVTAPPDIKADNNYRDIQWLAKRYAFSILPSVSSIQAFRKFSKSGRAQDPFVGFGDPLIGEEEGVSVGERRNIDISTVFRNVQKQTAGAIRGLVDVADVEAIRKAPRLPETADELRAMSKVLNGRPDSLWLQAGATESKVKNLDLSKFRTIAFATHGVMAGEIKGTGEPGLILTPPARASTEDDGYLSAGEIAKLKLNADWVLLSACNTAAADGTPGAEGLSGLAKAFFYAGARSLFVSHWAVASEATVKLTTAMLREYDSDKGQGKAEAHRKAMIALMDTPGHPEYAHPIFWAPFVVVGEGGFASH